MDEVMSNGQQRGTPQKKEDDDYCLKLIETIGFNGSNPGSLIFHPDRSHIVYPLGNTVVIEPIESGGKQVFLKGHTDAVTCVTISRSGKYIASGQRTHMGFKAFILVWDYALKKEYCKLDLHKVKVQDLAFSNNDLYLMSLGGQDDGCIIIWDIKKKDAVCGSEAALMSAGTTFCVAAANNNDKKFFSGGDGTLRAWELDVENRKIRPTDVNMGLLKRIVKKIVVAADDSSFYCATTTGDILRITISSNLLGSYYPQKNLFCRGVTSLVLMPDNKFLIGTGDGTVALACYSKEKFTVSKRVQVSQAGEITSITLRGKGHQFYVSTSNSHIYRFTMAEFDKYVLSKTCHHCKVNDINFPNNCSELFVTSAGSDIRVWNIRKDTEKKPQTEEKLRIEVPNKTCNAVCVMPDGGSIISGWDDNKIRAFKPLTGKLWYEIADAHNRVTALTVTSDSRRIISGGGGGQVRIWNIGVKKQELIRTLKEHKGVVSFLRVNSTNTECVSASGDGSCVIWDLQKFVRAQVVFDNTQFTCVTYSRGEGQILTSGTDRKIAYWNCPDGSEIREMEGSQTGAINTMDISPDGRHFVTGGDDELIRVWDFNEGVVTKIGTGHCSEITRLRICPNQKFIVSVSKDGAIFRWKYPV
nr:cilia- and flagella-associated protein 52-like [Lytechinus pictus]